MNASSAVNSSQQRLDAFVQAFEPCEHRIASYVFSLVPNRADAEDIVQDVSVVLWEKFESFTPGTDFAAWGCRIAFLTVLDYRRLKPRPLELSDEVVNKVSENYLQLGATIDAEQKMLLRCIDELADDQRKLVCQRHFPGNTLKVMADMFGISIPTLRKRLRATYGLLMGCIKRKLQEEDL